MHESMKKLVGDGPFPFALDRINEFLNMYSSDEVTIFESKKELDFSEPGMHTHDSYEFVVPFSVMPTTQLGEKRVEFEKNKLLPLNSQQPHGPAKKMLGCRLMSIHIERPFLQTVAYSVYGKKDVVFKNEYSTISPDIQNVLTRFMEESSHKQVGHRFILQSLATQMSIYLLRHLRSNMPSHAPATNTVGRENINKAIEFIREYYATGYSLGEVATVANLSPSHFIKTFKDQTGLTPHEYLIAYKVEKARVQLKTSNRTITEISSNYGFSSPSHFSQTFKRITGVTPTEYRLTIGK